MRGARSPRDRAESRCLERTEHHALPRERAHRFAHHGDAETRRDEPEERDLRVRLLDDVERDVRRAKSAHRAMSPRGLDVGARHDARGAVDVARPKERAPREGMSDSSPTRGLPPEGWHDRVGRESLIVNRWGKHRFGFFTAITIACSRPSAARGRWASRRTADDLELADDLPNRHGRIDEDSANGYGLANGDDRAPSRRGCPAPSA